MSAGPPHRPGERPLPSQGRAFLAVLRRDVYVTWGELPVFLAQVILQPLFLLFVFGKVLGLLGYTQHGYADLLFPGLLALTAVITGHADARLPARDRVRLDEGDRGPPARADVDRARGGREGPVRRPAGDHRDHDHDPGRDPRARVDPVALERACRCSSSRSSSAALLGRRPRPRDGHAREAATGSTSSSRWSSRRCCSPAAASTRGRRCRGCRWFQVVTACNPMTYVSEAMRAALVPVGAAHRARGSASSCWSARSPR